MLRGLLSVSRMFWLWKSWVVGRVRGYENCRLLRVAEGLCGRKVSVEPLGEMVEVHFGLVRMTVWVIKVVKVLI